MARTPCLKCCRKHLAKAEALMSEALLGHEDHGWLAVGQLSEAEDEIVALYPAVAEAIREHRKRYEDSLDEGTIYLVPTLEMITAISRFHKEQQNVQSPSAVPSTPRNPTAFADGDSVPGMPRRLSDPAL